MALTPEGAASYGLNPPYSPRGRGDQSILDCLSVLRELQGEGKIREIGLAGYPLPVLLRLSLVALHTHGIPVDIVQSYAHQTIQNSSLEEGYLRALTDQAKVGQVMNAAPLAMGILTTSGGPEWHPARGTPIFGATRQAADKCREMGTTLEDVACDFGYRTVRQEDGRIVPVVIGCKNLEEVHMSLRSYKRANGQGARRDVEEQVIKIFDDAGVRHVSW